MDAVTYRLCTMQDFDQFMELYCAELIENYGQCSISAEELKSDWKTPGFDVTKHFMAAFTAEGRMVGYNELRSFRQPPVRPYLYGYVLPEYRGQGIGSYLVRWGMEAARQLITDIPPEARLVLQAFGNSEDRQILLQEAGFINTRSSLVMGIELTDKIPAPAFPENFHIVTMADHPHLADFVRVSEAAFRDHRGHIEEPLERVVARWQGWIDSATSYDPELFMLLRDGDEDAGVLLAWPTSEQDADSAWVANFGILPAYRRRGLASALLYHAFYVFRIRGRKGAGLSVDGSSLTGANRVYEKVGMDIRQVYRAYEYEVREGIEMTQQG